VRQTGTGPRFVEAVGATAVGGHAGPERGAGGGVDWLDGHEDEVWRLLLAVHADLLARLDDDLRRDHELNLADYEVLVALSEADGALRMSELAERVMLSPSGLTRRVDRLVTRGLVARRACPSDGRGSLAALTPVGRSALVRAAPTHVAGVRRYLLDPISPTSLGPLAAGLRQVRGALHPEPVRARQPRSAP
jgi:DNA-binding MarR family transcriptional regulator